LRLGCFFTEPLDFGFERLDLLVQGARFFGDGIIFLSEEPHTGRLNGAAGAPQ
jgi:hypothetical protein